MNLQLTSPTGFPGSSNATALALAELEACEAELVPQIEALTLAVKQAVEQSREQKTPKDLVDAGNDDFLKALMAEPKPTNDFFYHLARKHDQLKYWLRIEAVP